MAAVALVTAPAGVSADSFFPIRIQVSIAPVARLDHPLKVKVAVSADPGALSAPGGHGPVRARVKLSSGECGASFQYTSGVVLLDRPLSPQPSATALYQGSATGSGRPTTYGRQTVCAYIENDYQLLGSDTTDYQVNVSRGCTTAAARYDRARRHHRGARKLRRLKRSARSACGPGVPL